MATKGPRYRFVLVEEPAETLPQRYRRGPRIPPRWLRRTDPIEVLLEAFLKLSHRGVGETAWAPSLADNPLAFLLDAMGDAVVLRHRDGCVAYANPAAQQLGAVEEQLEPLVALETIEIDERPFERRCMAFGQGRRTLILEVLRRRG